LLSSLKVTKFVRNLQQTVDIWRASSSNKVVEKLHQRERSWPMQIQHESTGWYKRLLEQSGGIQHILSSDAAALMQLWNSNLSVWIEEIILSLRLSSVKPIKSLLSNTSPQCRILWSDKSNACIPSILSSRVKTHLIHCTLA
jgi:hypothetical protein